MKVVQLVVLLTAGSSVCGTTLADDSRSIEHVTGGLYQVHAGGNYHSALLLTSDGIIAFDPISRDAAIWLRDEVKKRFDLPIKYLVYSHSDADHSSGREIFSDAIVVGHEKAK